MTSSALLTLAWVCSLVIEMTMAHGSISIQDANIKLKTTTLFRELSTIIIRFSRNDRILPPKAFLLDFNTKAENKSTKAEIKEHICTLMYCRHRCVN